jgi:hypothetical protein
MGQQRETDYLVVGAGAAGMAFTDALLTHTDATVTVVDRRHAPGGHWVDAYPYVRLHQPSTFYGVDSVQGEHRFTSRITGVTHDVHVRRKLVDTTYLEGSIPATSPPPFEVAEGARVVTPGELARLAAPPERFVIIGAGKTALDTCVWLLEQGVAASAIRWVRPREGWWLNRRFQQPHTLLPDLYRGAAIQMEALALAGSVEELFSRLESEGVVLRIDPQVAPTMFHGAIISEPELALLRRVGDVIRMGRVRRIERDAIILDEGRVPTDGRTVHIHCAATGLARPALRPVFEPGRVTVQPIMWGFACYQFAMLGVVEAVVDGDAEKNRLCPPIPYWDTSDDYLTAYEALLVGDRARAAHPVLSKWNKATRLNPVSGIGAHQADPRVSDARERIKRHGAAAVQNLQKLRARAG